MCFFKPEYILKIFNIYNMKNSYRKIGRKHKAEYSNNTTILTNKTVKPTIGDFSRDRLTFCDSLRYSHKFSIFIYKYFFLCRLHYHHHLQGWGVQNILLRLAASRREGIKIVKTVLRLWTFPEINIFQGSKLPNCWIVRGFNSSMQFCKQGISSSVNNNEIAQCIGCFKAHLSVAVI